jgi:hypothetical protein
MSRPRRSPAPPGRVLVVCSGRGEPKHEGERRIKALQANGNAETGLTFTWIGASPVTPFAHVDGETLRFRCPKCRRYKPISRDNFARVVLVIAAIQGGWDDPVTVDLSRIERAL